MGIHRSAIINLNSLLPVRWGCDLKSIIIKAITQNNTPGMRS